MLGQIWRAASEFVDWRTHIRRLEGRPLTDVSFITNIRDETDKRRFLGNWVPYQGHCKGPVYWVNGINGHTRALFMTTDELKSCSGRQKAKRLFIRATSWAEAQGSMVILLAANTKKLFGNGGNSIQEMFPNLLFTIGDNGTAFILKSQTLEAFGRANLQPASSRVGIIGCHGHLGLFMLQALKKEGYDVVGLGRNTISSVQIVRSFGELGKLDAVVACHHNDDYCVTASNVDLIRKPNRKLLMVDVAQPFNLRYPEFLKCRDRVIHLDAGNPYNARLKYVLGFITYRMFRMPRKTAFGCFSEALALAMALRNGNKSVLKRDWFKVSDANINLMAELFNEYGFVIPRPRCFGVPIKNFSLQF